jgi:carotenoid cleavage dioxygenase-like enzyme
MVLDARTQKSPTTPKKRPALTPKSSTKPRDAMRSLYEGGLPMLLNARTLQTQYECSFDGALWGYHFLAHTRYDKDRHLIVGIGISQVVVVVVVAVVVVVLVSDR